MKPLEVDVLVFGGGAAGLWMLDELRRLGFAALLVESRALGAGQTICAQGIIHGGIKYSLAGLLSDSARAIREMPQVWRDCLAGRREPELRETAVLADSCLLWRTDSWTGKLGMTAASAGLRSRVRLLKPAERPGVLAGCPGDVLAVDEPVIDAASLLRNLAQRNPGRILRIAADPGPRFASQAGPGVTYVTLTHPESGATLQLRPRHVVFAAGAGNPGLRRRAGLENGAAQVRPLHMVLLNGDLPPLFGHCIDGAKTRATITSATSASGRTVWHVGGQIAEDGVALSEAEVIALARRELVAVLPGLDLRRVQAAAYRVDRAEPRTSGNARPSGPVIRREGNVLTAWPTKLALAPRLAIMAVEEVGAPVAGPDAIQDLPTDWPRPEVARPPWETCATWHGADAS